MLNQSRPPPPRVPPITHAGIRYEQVRNARALGFDQVTGYLAVIDERTGERLWTVKVYDNPVHPKMEADVQLTYFSAMELNELARELRITNEDHECFVVELDRQRVRLGKQ